MVNIFSFTYTNNTQLIHKGDEMKKIVIAIVTLLGVLIIVDYFVLEDSITNQANNETVPSASIVEGTEAEQAAGSVQDYGLQVGQKAPDFTLETLSGTTLTLTDLSGKKVLLNFWASWCGPCKDEMPHMQKVYEQYKDKGVEIVAINLTIGKESSEDAQQFVDEYGLTFPVPLDIGGKVQEAYEIFPIPTSYFIDADGIIQSKYLGPMTEEYIINELNKL